MELIELSKAEIVETPAEGATLFCLNPDGTVNRVSAANVGGNAGSGGIKTAIIKDSLYDQTVAGVQSYASAEPEITYSCTNMTFEEAYETLASGEPMNVCEMIVFKNLPIILSDVVVMFAGTSVNNTPAIELSLDRTDLQLNINLYWTADGISTERPRI